MLPWPEHYKATYFYTTTQLSRQSLASAVVQVPYYVDVNAAPLLFSKCALLQLVQTQMPRLEQLGARTLFVGMPKASELSYDDTDRELFDMIRTGAGRGGCCKDGEVDDSEPIQSDSYAQPGYTQTDTYTQSGTQSSYIQSDTYT